MRTSKLVIGICVSFASLAALAASEASAQRRGGGGGRSFSAPSGGGGSFSRGGGIRSSASGNVNRAGSANRGGFNSASANRGNVNTGNINRGNVNTGNINRGNVNTGNINRGNVNTGNINTGDINIDRDVHVDGGYGWNDWDYHPVAVGAAVGTAVAVTSAWRLGAYYSTLPTNCVVVYRGTVTYYQCGTYWYQPVYSGMSVQYVAVKVP